MAATCNGQIAVVQWLLAEGGASITGPDIWGRLPADDEKAARLIRTLALYEDPPEGVLGVLNSTPLRVLAFRQAAQLRGRLPQWLAARATMIGESMPLPPPLVLLVLEYAKPHVDEIWAAGPRNRRRPRTCDATVGPVRRSLRLQQQRQSS